MEGQESPRTSPDIWEVENFSIVLIGSSYKGPLLSLLLSRQNRREDLPPFVAPPEGSREAEEEKERWLPSKFRLRPNDIAYLLGVLL